MPFDVQSLFPELGTEASLPKLTELFVRMAFATLLGSAIAFRAWRHFMPFMSRPSLQSAQSQTLIAAAGAVMVVVIGDSPARAFGLVGLGSFIRFRSGIGDPRDAAVLFVMIGIGMACGLGLFAMATASTAFVALLLTVFDYGARRQTKPTLISIQAEDASSLQRRVRDVFPDARLVEIASNAPELGKDSGKVVIELLLRPDEDAGSLREAFDEKGVTGIRRIALSDED
jgi:uncharacterized membrane protein YhiD involved in acid resistance